MSNRDDFNSSTRAPAGSTGAGSRVQSGAAAGGQGGNYAYSTVDQTGGTQQIRDQAGNIRTVVVGNYNTGGAKVGAGNAGGVYNGNGQRIGGAMPNSFMFRNRGVPQGYSSYPGTAGPIDRYMQQVNLPQLPRPVPVDWPQMPPMGAYYNQFEAGRIPGTYPTTPTQPQPASAQSGYYGQFSPGRIPGSNGYYSNDAVYSPNTPGGGLSYKANGPLGSGWQDRVPR